MKTATGLRRLRLVILLFYRRHPAMAQRTRRFRIFVSLLLMLVFVILCSAIFTS